MEELCANCGGQSNRWLHIFALFHWAAGGRQVDGPLGLLEHCAGDCVLVRPNRLVRLAPTGCHTLAQMPQRRATCAAQLGHSTSHRRHAPAASATGPHLAQLSPRFSAAQWRKICPNLCTSSMGISTEFKPVAASVAQNGHTLLQPFILATCKWGRLQLALEWPHLGCCARGSAAHCLWCKWCTLQAALH